MRSAIGPGLVLLLTACAAVPSGAPRPGPEGAKPVATFSIVARDPATGDLGVAVESKFFGVGAVVPWARADVGAVATQAWANTTWGPAGLALMERGLAPKQVIATLTERDSGRDYRQVGMVDAAGRAAAYTGKGANAWAGHVVGDGFACQGNILAGEGVVNAMAKTFRESTGPLPERLVAALAAGQAAGGDRRGRQSAALLVVRRGGGYAGFNDRMVDIRVDDNEKPIEELRRLLALHRRAFGTAPLPDAEKGLTMEPAPKAGSLATPRAAWETWVARFRAKDWEGLYAIQTKEYRAGESLADFRAGMEARADEIAAFLDRVRYAGTRIDGDRAVVALSAPGSPRPIYQSFVREDGVWRMPD